MGEITIKPKDHTDTFSIQLFIEHFPQKPGRFKASKSWTIFLGFEVIWQHSQTKYFC